MAFPVSTVLQAQPSPAGEKSSSFDLIIEGKRYASFEEYKREKSTQRLEVLLAAEPADFQQDLARFFSKLSAEELQALSLAELKTLLSPGNGSEPVRKPSSPAPRDETAELKALIEDYKREKSSRDIADVDFENMKSYQITPDGAQEIP